MAGRRVFQGYHSIQLRVLKHLFRIKGEFASLGPDCARVETMPQFEHLSGKTASFESCLFDLSALLVVPGAIGEMGCIVNLRVG